MFSSSYRRLVALVVLASLPLTTTFAAESGGDEVIDPRTRADVEATLPALESAYQAAPGNADARRAYAKVLLELGNVWKANDVIAPLATANSSNLADLDLGSRAALLTQDLERSEILHKRIMTLADKNSEAYGEAHRRLMHTYIQANRFDKIRKAPKYKYERESARHAVDFLRKFKGKPYGIEWTTADRTARMPFTNDIFEPGVLPYMDVTVNGHKLSFLLDTGGAYLYLDKGLFEKVGADLIQKTRNKYAYTNGEYVEEYLGSFDTFEIDGLKVTNIPMMATPLQQRGIEVDGIITTQFLKQFLSTIDYENNEIVLRERSDRGKAQFKASMAGRELVQIPFYMSRIHMMFAKGNFDGHGGMNMFMDSGLAAAQEAIITNESAQQLNLKKEEITGTRYYTAPVSTVGLDGLKHLPGTVLGNVFVDDNPYWSHGFLFDGLISHQYLWTQGSWTIDFDTMSYYFPAEVVDHIAARITEPTENTLAKIKLANPAPYVGSYEVAPGVDLVITAKDGVLMLQPPGQGPVGIDAFEDGTFGIPLANAVIEFEGDVDAGISAMNLIQGGNTTRGVKK